MKNWIAIMLFFLVTKHGTCQQFQALLDSGKSEFKRQSAEQTPDYTKAFALLQKAVGLDSNNAEARYFLGYAIDRLNYDDGSKMYLSNKQSTLEASEQFEKVNQLQKKYLGEIIVLDPYSKLGSIWGSLAEAYLNRGSIDSAKWAFQEGKRRGGFIEPLLELNRQMLNSCEKDAILITYGDNVTIPIWYLQTIENLRTDIIVIDANLINASWYPKYLKNIRGLKMSLSDLEIDSINYLEWLPTDMTIEDSKDTSKKLTWLLKPTYVDQYILKGDRILLDVFKQNLFDRVFYFSNGSDSTYNLFLTDYLINDGLVSRLLLQKNDLTITPTIISKNLDAYNIDKLDKEEISKSKDAIFALNGFRWAFYGNSYFVFTKGETIEAKTLLKKMESKFNPNKLPYDSEDFERRIKELKQKLNFNDL